MNRAQRELKRRILKEWREEEKNRVKTPEEIEEERRVRRKENVLLAIVLIGLAVYAFLFHGRNEIRLPQEGEMAMYSINVGQADATFFIFPDGSNLLVDAGEVADGAKVTGLLKKLGVGKVDAIMVSHPHIDHIGGLIPVLERYGADVIYMPDHESETITYKRVMKAAEETGTPIRYLYDGDSFDGGSYKITILSPENKKYTDDNQYSVVMKIDYKDVSFLMMGDADKMVERELIEKYGDGLECTVLKVAHHGSDTATTEEFLDAASPSVAVVSAKAGPSLNIPADSVVSRIAKREIRVLRTSRNGNIEILTDGEALDIRTSGTTRENKISETVDKYFDM